MNKYEITIFSPEDNEEHVLYAEGEAPLAHAMETLSASMEPGSWFKVRRMYENE